MTVDRRQKTFKEHNMISMDESMLLKQYISIRNRSLTICAPLEIEDYVLQPIVDVSPPKWHLGHTTWFFETFILAPNYFGYKVFNEKYNFIFNSYYETIGARVIRTDRGNLSRPTVMEVKTYRHYVDEAMTKYLLEETLDEAVKSIFILGLNHEQQHQELLITDIKYILGHNPLFPPYNQGTTHQNILSNVPPILSAKDASIQAGIYEIGYAEDGFCFDNELARHKVYVEAFTLSKNLVSNAEYLAFMEDGGYSNFVYWHADGWEWVKNNAISAPLYWYKIKNKWEHYTLKGLKELDMAESVCHISYYEAAAFATWKGSRLPTEAEWEIASEAFEWGQRWEWTESAYLPYPEFKKGSGAIGEYNGKFMINQMVLRGASIATSPGHSRKTYRNFFQAPLRWQFTGIRLIK